VCKRKENMDKRLIEYRVWLKHNLIPVVYCGIFESDEYFERNTPSNFCGYGYERHEVVSSVPLFADQWQRYMRLFIGEKREGD
jgi:hypothetical protein